MIPAVPWFSSFWWEEPLPTAVTASGRVLCFVLASILNLNLKRKKKITLNANILTLNVVL